MNKYIVELIGTFFLVLTVLCTAVYGTAPALQYLAPLAIGSSLMIMVYAGGHFSGGHYNPAVTIGVWLRGRCSAFDVIPYILSQLAGAALAYVAAGQLFLKKLPAVVATAAPEAADAAAAACPVAEWGVTATILAEFLFTFALVYVVLNSATSKNTAGNSFYGLAIGFTVVVGAITVGGISGGAFNPAVAFGVALTGKVGVLSFCTIWMHLVGQVLAALVAGFLFKAINPEDK